MPTTLLEKKIESLPQEYIQMVANYVEFLEYKIKSESEGQKKSIDEQIAQSHMNVIWEELKNDTW